VGAENRDTAFDQRFAPAWTDVAVPAYSSNVKHDRVGCTSVTGPEDFKTKVIGALRRLQKMPHIVQAFFADPELRYITA
jgi:hypothetical protein